MTTQTRKITHVFALLLLGICLAPIPAVASTQHASVDGALGKLEVREVVVANIGDVRDCYDAELVEDESVEGRAVVSFVIQPDGTVSEADVSESTMPERFDACLAAAVEGWSFPTSDASTNVTYPFNMHPG
jgi:TonB family protein